MSAFLEGQIRFTAIPDVIDAALSAHEGDDDPDLETIDAADAWARRFAARHIRARAPV